MGLKAINHNDVAIVSVKESDYIVHFWYMSETDAVIIMNNSNPNDKRSLLYFFYYV